MAQLLKTLGVSNEFPNATTILLWIGSAILIIVAANWTVIRTHAHDDLYPRKEEVRRNQEKLEKHISKLTDTIFDQTMVLNEMRGRMEWLRPAER